MMEQALSREGAFTDGEPGAEAAVARLLLSEAYTGSFAHPSILKDLNEVVNDGAERAFALTEREQQHRHECDKLALRAEIRDVDRGSTDRRIVIVFLICFVSAAVSASFFAAFTGHIAASSVAGLFGVAIAVGGLVKLAPSRLKKEDGKSEAK
jgi:uncharacterized membrane protein